MITQKLDENWQVAGYWTYAPVVNNMMENGHEPKSLTGYVPASVPGSLTHDLFRAGIIPDPLFERNSHAQEWIGNRWWVYKNETLCVSSEFKGKTIRLIFRGIDYRARFYLNNVHLGDHEGMFHPAVFDVTDTIRYDGPNILKVCFEHTPFEHSYTGYNSQKSTVKTHCSYKWDFCLRLVDMGIYDEALLDVTSNSSFGYADIRYLDQPAGCRRVCAKMEIDSKCDQRAEVAANLSFGGKIQSVETKTVDLKAGRNTVAFELPVSRPKLWWPNGYGGQPLYDFCATVSENGEISDRFDKKVGLRTIAYCRTPKAPEDAFPYTVIVNGRKIWLKGANTNPIDLQTGLSTDARYERIVKLAREGNLNAFRIWGGGNFEREAFYDLCDRYGILIFQEFQQSNITTVSFPSDDPKFLELFKTVSAHVVKTLRNHPCLMSFSGGNEMRDPGTMGAVGFDHPNIAMLKALVDEHAPGILMLPTSGTGPFVVVEHDKLEDPDIVYHDVHGPWTYMGDGLHYRMWNAQNSMMNSEFGCAGMANNKVLPRIIGRRHLHTRDGNTMANEIFYHHHDGWDTYARDQALFGDIESIEDYILLSQYIQAEALRYGYESCRRRAFDNVGAFVWQFNEPMPNACCTNVVDYYGQPKFAYYFIRDALKGVHVSLMYDRLAYALSPPDAFKAKVFVHNDHAAADYECAVRILGDDRQELAKFGYAGESAAEGAVCAGGLEWRPKGAKEVFYAECALEMNGKTDKNVYMFFIRDEKHPLFCQEAVKRFVRDYEKF